MRPQLRAGKREVCTGKTVRVCAIAKGAAAAAAEAAGADIVGDDELIARIAGGFMDFDEYVSGLVTYERKDNRS